MATHEKNEREGSLREDVQAWAQSLRFSALTVLLVGIVITAAIVLTPNVSIYLQQQREIAERTASVELHREALTELEAQQIKWQDPVYIRAQARERLYYVMPGEIQVSVIDDGVLLPDDDTPKVSATLTKTERHWAKDLVSSVLIAATTHDDPRAFTQR